MRYMVWHIVVFDERCYLDTQKDGQDLDIMTSSVSGCRNHLDFWRCV
jgi:hypothetical protein